MQSIIQKSKFCFLCGRGDTDEHHCIGGSNRHMSDKYGLTVRLCRKCHEIIHNSDNDSMGKEAELYLKRVAQKKFEEKYSHELWMKEFGRNYL